MIDLGLLLKALPVISSFYDRLFKQPDLGLEVERTSVNVYGGAVHLIPDVIVRNQGRGAAEEAHVEMSLPDWDFEQDEETEYPSNDMGDWNIRYAKTGYIGKVGHHHVLHFEDTIPAQTPAHIYLGTLSFEKNSKYELEYEIRCTAHSPREGKVVFKTDEGGVEISNKRPSLLVELAGILSNKIETLRHGRDNGVDVATDLRFTNTEEDDERITASAAIRNNTGKSISFIGANVWIERDDGESVGDSGTTRTRASAIAPGEQWTVQETYTLNDSNFDIERWTPRIEVDYDLINSWEYPRGVELTDIEKTPSSLQGGVPQTAKVEGTVVNTNNTTTEPFWLYARFKSAEGTIIEVKADRLRLEPQETCEFHYRPSDADIDLQRSVESIDVLLRK